VMTVKQINWRKSILHGQFNIQYAAAGISKLF
jgi:hypothetical protein